MSCFQQLWPRKWRIRLTTEYLKYVWWLKSCTSWYVVYPIIYKVYISQVVQDFFHQQYVSGEVNFPVPGFQVEEHFPYFQRPFAHLLHPDCNCTYGQQQLVGYVVCFLAGLWIRAFRIFCIDIDPRFLVDRNASCWWKSVVHISTIFERLPSQTSTLPTNIIGFTLTNYYSGNLKDVFRLYRQVRFLCYSVVCASRWPKISHRWHLGFDTRGVWHNGSLKCRHSN